MKSFVVVGLGRFGTETARKLCQSGCEVLVIDRSNELVQQISDLFDLIKTLFSL